MTVTLPIWQWVTLLGTIVLTLLGLWGRLYQVRTEAFGEAESLRKDALAAMRRLGEVERKAREYFDTIEGVIAERQVWRSLYMEQSAGHDNAQGLMMREISRLSVAYERAAGKPFPLDKTVQAVREQWGEAHGPVAVQTRVVSETTAPASGPSEKA